MQNYGVHLNKDYSYIIGRKVLNYFKTAAEENNDDMVDREYLELATHDDLQSKPLQSAKMRPYSRDQNLINIMSEEPI